MVIQNSYGGSRFGHERIRDEAERKYGKTCIRIRYDDSRDIYVITFDDYSEVYCGTFNGNHFNQVDSKCISCGKNSHVSSFDSRGRCENTAKEFANKVRRLYWHRYSKMKLDKLIKIR